MPFVKNKSEHTFRITWGGVEYVFEPNQLIFVPEQVLIAFFPVKKFQEYFPEGAVLNENDILKLLNIFYGRWGVQLSEIGVTVDNFLEFITENFDVFKTQEITVAKKESIKEKEASKKKKRGFDEVIDEAVEEIKAGISKEGV